VPIEGPTPAFADDLPPLGTLVADEVFWRYPSGTPGSQGVAHLRVWLTSEVEPGHLAVVTETGPAGSMTNSAASIRAELARRYGTRLVLLEHCPAAGTGEFSGSLDLVRLGADGSPRWSRVWPTDDDHPRHARLEAWMDAYGWQIVAV
jgi:hypothetical protein